MSGQTTRPRDRLPEEEIKEGIGLSSRSIKHVYGSQRPTAGPAIGSDPMRIGARCFSTELRGQCMSITNYAVLARILQARVGVSQIQRTPITVVHRCRHVVRYFALKD